MTRSQIELFPAGGGGSCGWGGGSWTPRLSEIHNDKLRLKQRSESYTTISSQSGNALGATQRCVQTLMELHNDEFRRMSRAQNSKETTTNNNNHGNNGETETYC